MKSAYLLTWNPKEFPWNDIEADAQQIIVGQAGPMNWSCGDTKRIQPGDRMFLLRQGVEPRGIVAAGWATSEPHLEGHWDDERAEQGLTATYVEIRFGRILVPGLDDPLPLATLKTGGLVHLKHRFTKLVCSVSLHSPTPPPLRRKMNAKETKIQPFIEGTKQFVVPLFQRPYSWEKKHWEDLWGDLMELYDEEQPRNHFMGSVVTMPAVSVPEGVTKYVLIDGQQRITTTLILLSLVRDIAKTLPGTLSAQIENLLLLNPYQEGSEQYKLLPTQADRDSFSKLVKGESITEENQVTKAYRYFEKQLRLVENLNLEKLRSIVVRNLVIVSIVLDADDNPHLIFESLNAKGRALTQADLIRNYFFMRMDAAQQEKMYQQYWAPLQNRLSDALTECIRHFLMKDGFVVKQGEVFFTLKYRADKKSREEVLEYLVGLVEFAGYYEKFLSPVRESTTALRQRFERLNKIEITTAYPFLLNIYRDYDKQKLSLAEFSSILDALENFMVRRFICGVPTNTLNKMFPLLYSQAKQHDVLGRVDKL